MYHRIIERSKFFVSRYIALTLIVGLILRIVLLMNHQTTAIPGIFEIVKTFILGVVYDFCFSMVALIPFLLLFLGWTNFKYNKWVAMLIEGFLVGMVIYVFCFHSIFDQYGGGAPLIAQIFFTYKLVSYSLRLFLPGIRKVWRLVSCQLLFFVYIFLTLLNAVSEYFFWNEFGVRYNFIAVDYLIYTSEVLGNIFESYPIVPLFVALVFIALLIQYWIQRKSFYVGADWSSRELILSGGLIVVGAVFGMSILSFSRSALQSENVFANELQSNGCYDFISAFKENKLNYEQFYALQSKEECEALMQKLCHRNLQNIQQISDSAAMVDKNIILITVESLSASFLKTYGNDKNLTPNLDRLMQESLVFDSLYAVGNRTVRGLEAVSRCAPPTTGESLIKRPDNANLFTVGSLLSRHGYQSKFLYGGNSYFDNMGTYFGGNKYEVIDKKSIDPAKITFSNIWGVCDEDMFEKAISIMDEDAIKHEKTFLHIMTVSNHRPFTFPKGRIALQDEPEKSRDGGVKYTDYAIGKFIEKAKSRSWFKNTIFVVVADHCASSAGNIAIPIDNYHIPAFVYSPGYITPKRVSKLCSQIDLMPTVLRLIHLSYESKFIGQNILSADFDPRAFMATYQDMGYLKNGILTVLSPVKRVKQYDVKFIPGKETEEMPVHKRNLKLIDEAQAFYQTSNMYVDRDTVNNTF